MSFLPYVRRFLYGEGKGSGRAGAESPIRVFRRTDVAHVRIVSPGIGPDPIVCRVAHVDLCFFFDIDVVILVVEIFASELPLAHVQDLMYRFGRSEPIVCQVPP